MDELKDLLDQGLVGFEPATEWFEPTLKRVRRRQRRRRFATGALAFLVFAAAGVGLWAAFVGGTAGPKPAHPQPTPSSIEAQIAELEARWTALDLQLTALKSQQSTDQAELIRLQGTLRKTGDPSKRLQLTAQIDALTAQIDALTAEMTPLVQQFNAVQATLASLEGTSPPPGYSCLGVGDAARAGITRHLRSGVQLMNAAAIPSLRAPGTWVIAAELQTGGGGAGAPRVATFATDQAPNVGWAGVLVAANDAAVAYSTLPKTSSLSSLLRARDDRLAWSRAENCLHG